MAYTVFMNTLPHNNELIERIIAHIFKGHTLTPAKLEKRYPKRVFSDVAAKVTRFAPSPTGFMHIGGMYNSLISERIVHAQNHTLKDGSIVQNPRGVFYLRIEDTDSKRKVEGATELIVSSLANFGIEADEGPDTGSYGPYYQSERKEIYDTFCIELLRKDLAYICFATPEELENNRHTQELQKIRPGYYGSWALYRNTPLTEVITKLEAGTPFVIRLKSQGNFDNKVEVNDIIRGKLHLSQNDQDTVIRKADGFPTYHFAHAIDDHFMHTTHVIRGDEWVASTTLHLELFSALGFTPPTYGHILPIQKIDGTKRKLSKRKDPEANMQYYVEKGYTRDAVIEYLLNLANSSFENWRQANPTLSWKEFPFSIELLSHSTGPLFDPVKLNNVAKEVVARMSAHDVYTESLAWARVYNPTWANILERDSAYTTSIFSIERSGAKVRKDIGTWSEVESTIGYFFDDIFAEKIAPTVAKTLATLPNVDANIIATSLQSLAKITDEKLNAEDWLIKVRELAHSLGYAENTKLYKQNPESYKGYIAHITAIFRVALTGTSQTPDLYQVISVLGPERTQQRIARACKDIAA